MIAVTVAGLLPSLTPHAASTNSVKDTLELILDTEKRTCGVLPVEAGEKKTLTTSAGASIAAMVRQLLLDFHIGGDIETAKETYVNVTQQDLLQRITKGIDCNLSVYQSSLFILKKLSPKTEDQIKAAVNQLPSEVAVSVWATLLLPDEIGRRILLPKTAETKYGCSDEPAQIGIVCLKSANYKNKSYEFLPDPGYHWEPAKIEFREIEGFGKTGAIGYEIKNGAIVVGAWVRSDPPNKAKASIIAYEYRDDPIPKFGQIFRGTLKPPGDLAVPLRGASDWQVRLNFPATEYLPARERIVTSESPESLSPFLQIERLASGQIIMKTTTQAPQW